MNTDSINFGTSITEISVIAQHSALGMRFYKFDLKDKEEAKLKIGYMLDGFKRLRFDGLGTRIFTLKVEPRRDSKLNYIEGEYEMTLRVGNMYQRGTCIGDSVKYLRTPGYQETVTYLYKYEDDCEYDEDGDYVGDSLDDDFIYKQTWVTKVQGHSWTSGGGPTEEITDEDWADRYLDDENLARTPHHTL